LWGRPIGHPCDNVRAGLKPALTIMNDKRIYERFIARFPAKFKDVREDFGVNVFLREASAGGVKIRCKERLYINDSISIEVKLPDDIDPMILKGEVVWAKNPNPALWDIGLQFHKVHLMHMSRLYKFIAPNAA